MGENGYDIRAVCFDIGNVILRFNVAEIARKMAWAARGRPLQVGRYLWNSKIGRQVERGNISGRKLYAMFRRDLAFSGDFEKFRTLWCDHFTLDRRAAAIVKRVAARKRVYLVSNTNHLHYQFIRKRYAFPRWVDGAVLSYRLGVCKPDAGIYRAALRRAGVRPEQGLLIDDLPANVEGARRVGMHAILYSGAEALERELKMFGVL